MRPAAHLLPLILARPELQLAPPSPTQAPRTLLNLIIQTRNLIILLQNTFKLRFQIRKVLLKLFAGVGVLGLLLLLLRLHRVIIRLLGLLRNFRFNGLPALLAQLFSFLRLDRLRRCNARSLHALVIHEVLLLRVIRADSLLVVVRILPAVVLIIAVTLTPRVIVHQRDSMSVLPLIHLAHATLHLSLIHI